MQTTSAGKETPYPGESGIQMEELGLDHLGRAGKPTIIRWSQIIWTQILVLVLVLRPNLLIREIVMIMIPKGGSLLAVVFFNRT